uniref:RHD domain-containing protein n=1 Tax=Glossina pallidipes TaxID=7398 RepID=A0A1A9ZN75_GLOPL
MERNDAVVDILKTLDNNSPELNENPAFLEVQAITNATSVSSSGSSSPTFNQKCQKSTNILRHENSYTASEKPYIRIVEQPANKALRFRYECEGRSAGSIPGANSTTENKTFPTIEIAGYKGEVTIVVSCVTKDAPYRPHPHNLVGKEGCEYGICTMRVKGDPPRAVFSNLGVQCVRKKDIKAALELRENRNVDPFKTKFAHKDQPSSIDLNVVRLCFQAFILSGPRQYKKLTPVVSDPVYDRKAVSDLAINRLCSCSAKMSGGDEIIMLCEKVPKDIKIKFYELSKEGTIVWEDYAVFQHTDIHKHTAIAFKTPRYHNPEAIHRPQVYIQLVRPSDGATSEPLPFEYYSDPGTSFFMRLQRKRELQENLKVFQQIMSLDGEKTKQINENAINDMIICRDSVRDSLHASEKPFKPSYVCIEKCDVNRKTPNERVELQMQKLFFPLTNNLTHSKPDLDDKLLGLREVEESIDLSTMKEITAWMHSNDLECNLVIGTNGSIQDNDGIIMNRNHIKTLRKFNDNIDISPLIGQPKAENYFSFSDDHDAENNETNVANNITCIDDSSKDDSFDETSTHNSFELALKNPIEMPTQSIGFQSLQESLVTFNPSTPTIQVDTVETSETTPPTCSNLRTSSNTVLKISDQVLPALPPKPTQEIYRKTNSNSPSSHIAQSSRNGSCSSLTISQTTALSISDQDSNKHSSTMSMPSRKKKNFFSRLFSRKKKNQTDVQAHKEESNCKLRVPANNSDNKKIYFSLGDSKRTSLRSIKSLQLDMMSYEFDRKKSNSERLPGRGVNNVSVRGEGSREIETQKVSLENNPFNKNLKSVDSLERLEGLVDHKTLNALQLANVPLSDGDMELVAIADRQSIKNLCDGSYGVLLHPKVDLTEAEHFALYTNIPLAFESEENTEEFDQCQILTPAEVARRLTSANTTK